MTGLLFIQQTSHTQVPMPLKSQAVSKEVFVNIGFEPQLVTTLGFAHPWANWRRRFIGASVKLAPLSFQNKPYKLNSFITLPTDIKGVGKVRVTPQLFYVHQKDRAGSFSSVGFEINGTTWWEGRRWIKGIEQGWQHNALTYIKFFSVSRETFKDRYIGEDEPDPADGWFGCTAIRIRLGFATAKEISKNLRWQLSFGSLVSLQKQKIFFGFSHAQMPVYLGTMFRYTEK